MGIYTKGFKGLEIQLYAAQVAADAAAVKV